MASTIFYSWQSDLPNATNRGFIELALTRAARAIADDDSIQVEPVVDRDTAGVAGSPDIAATIYEKIARSEVFVCDVSIIGQAGGRPVPSPNVLIELGYAIHAIDWGRIILVMNRAFGALEHLPFDLRMKRALDYEMLPDMERPEERNRLQSKLTEALRLIFVNLESVREKDEKARQLPTPRDVEWRDANRGRALEGARKMGLRMHFEAFAVTTQPRPQVTPSTLFSAASAAQQEEKDDVPLGFMNQSFRPRPTADGIGNEMALDHLPLYQYWALRRDGSCYVLDNLFEEQHYPGRFIFSKRIAQTAELICYLSSLHQRLGTPPGSRIHVAVRYEGLSGTQVATADGRPRIGHPPPLEDDAECFLEAPVETLQARVLENTKTLTTDLFALFDFWSPSDADYERLVAPFTKPRGS